LEKSKLNKEKAEEEEAVKGAEKARPCRRRRSMDGISKDKEEDAKSEDIGDDDDEEEDEDDGDYEVIDREEANEGGVSADANIPEDDEDEPDILMSISRGLGLWTHSPWLRYCPRSPGTLSISSLLQNPILFSRSNLITQHTHCPPSFSDGPHRG